MLFADFINEDPKEVPTIKYAEFLVYLLGEKVKELKK
jgi:hypothetical protein